MRIFRVIILAMLLIFPRFLFSQTVIRIQDKLVLIDIVESSGLKSGDQVTIARKDAFGRILEVGQVEILRFRDGKCAGQILSEVQNYIIQKGDFIKDNLEDLFSAAGQDAVLPIAVLDFDAPDISASARVALSNVVRKELMGLGSYIVVDRNNMNKILEEHDFQQTGLCTNVECMVQAGRLLCVRKMIGGSIGLLGKRYMIDLKVVDVETGKIEKMDSEDHFGALESIDKPIVILTKRLAGAEMAVKSGTFIVPIR